MAISVTDFSTWKSDPVTKAFFQACEIRRNDAKEILATSAGLDSSQDSFYRGFISAYLEIPDFRIDDLEGLE